MKKMLDCAHYPYIILIILILCKSLIFTNELIK